MKFYPWHDFYPADNRLNIHLNNLMTEEHKEGRNHINHRIPR